VEAGARALATRLFSAEEIHALRREASAVVLDAVLPVLTEAVEGLERWRWGTTQGPAYVPLGAVLALLADVQGEKDGD
jgi:hypothetical protein